MKMLDDQKAQLEKQAEQMAIGAQSLSDEQIRAIDLETPLHRHKDEPPK